MIKRPPPNALQGRVKPNPPDYSNNFGVSPPQPLYKWENFSFFSPIKIRSETQYLSANEPFIIIGDETRKFLHVQNDSSQSIYIGFSVTPDFTTGAGGIHVPSGFGWESPSWMAPENDVTIVVIAGTGNRVNFLEGFQSINPPEYVR